MPVYAAVTYKATVKGATAVAVRCEKCENKYYYKLIRTAVGRCAAHYGIGAERAKKRARQLAKQQLRRMLESNIDPVPCPHCGWYQEEMKPLLRQGRLPRLRVLGIACLIIGGVALVPAALMGSSRFDDDTKLHVALISGSIGAVWLLAGALLLLVRRLKSASYDPNDPATEQERIELGRHRAITKEQAEALMEQQGG